MLLYFILNTRPHVTDEQHYSVPFLSPTPLRTPQPLSVGFLPNRHRFEAPGVVWYIECLWEYPHPPPRVPLFVLDDCESYTRVATGCCVHALPTDRPRASTMCFKSRAVSSAIATDKCRHLVQVSEFSVLALRRPSSHGCIPCYRSKGVQRSTKKHATRCIRLP